MSVRYLLQSLNQKQIIIKVTLFLLPQKDTQVSLFIWMSLGVKNNAEILCCYLFSSSYSSFFFFFLRIPLKSTEEKWNLKNDFLVPNFIFIIYLFLNYGTVVEFFERNQILICIKISHRQFVAMLPFHMKKIWCNHSFYYKNYFCCCCCRCFFQWIVCAFHGFDWKQFSLKNLDFYVFVKEESNSIDDFSESKH